MKIIVDFIAVATGGHRCLVSVPCHGRRTDRLFGRPKKTENFNNILFSASIGFKKSARHSSAALCTGIFIVNGPPLRHRVPTVDGELYRPSIDLIVYISIFQ